MSLRLMLACGALLAVASRGVFAMPVSLGVLTVDSHQTYYDGSNGTLSPEIAIPAGVTQIIFSFYGGVITDGTNQLASADGLYASGQTPYNFSNTSFSGTYKGVPIGRTTGIDPAIMGVFFSPTFTGTPADSLNYRSDSGITPDPRTLLEYSPSLNQPFWIGDGFDQNTPFNSAQLDANYVPPGTQQVYNVPAGAQYLLLGIGADINLADNQNSAGQGGSFGGTPEPATGLLLLLGAAGALSAASRRR